MATQHAQPCQALVRSITRPVLCLISFGGLRSVVSWVLALLLCVWDQTTHWAYSHARSGQETPSTAIPDAAIQVACLMLPLAHLLSLPCAQAALWLAELLTECLTVLVLFRWQLYQGTLGLHLLTCVKALQAASWTACNLVWATASAHCLVARALLSVFLQLTALHLMARGRAGCTPSGHVDMASTQAYPCKPETYQHSSCAPPGVMQGPLDYTSVPIRRHLAKQQHSQEQCQETHHTASSNPPPRTCWPDTTDAEATHSLRCIPERQHSCPSPSDNSPTHLSATEAALHVSVLSSPSIRAGMAHTAALHVPAASHTSHHTAEHLMKPVKNTLHTAPSAALQHEAAHATRQRLDALAGDTGLLGPTNELWASPCSSATLTGSGQQDTSGNSKHSWLLDLGTSSTAHSAMCLSATGLGTLAAAAPHHHPPARSSTDTLDLKPQQHMDQADASSQQAGGWGLGSAHSMHGMQAELNALLMTRGHVSSPQYRSPLGSHTKVSVKLQSQHLLHHLPPDMDTRLQKLLDLLTRQHRLPRQVVTSVAARQGCVLLLLDTVQAPCPEAGLADGTAPGLPPAVSAGTQQAADSSPQDQQACVTAQAALVELTAVQLVQALGLDTGLLQPGDFCTVQIGNEMCIARWDPTTCSWHTHGPARHRSRKQLHAQAHPPAANPESTSSATAAAAAAATAVHAAEAADAAAEPDWAAAGLSLHCVPEESERLTETSASEPQSQVAVVQAAEGPSPGEDTPGSSPALNCTAAPPILYTAQVLEHGRQGGSTHAAALLGIVIRDVVYGAQVLGYNPTDAHEEPACSSQLCLLALSHGKYLTTSVLHQAMHGDTIIVQLHVGFEGIAEEPASSDVSVTCNWPVGIDLELWSGPTLLDSFMLVLTSSPSGAQSLPELPPEQPQTSQSPSTELWSPQLLQPPCNERLVGLRGASTLSCDGWAGSTSSLALHPAHCSTRQEPALLPAPSEAVPCSTAGSGSTSATHKSHTQEMSSGGSGGSAQGMAGRRAGASAAVHQQAVCWLAHHKHSLELPQPPMQPVADTLSAPAWPGCSVLPPLGVQPTAYRDPQPSTGSAAAASRLVSSTGTTSPRLLWQAGTPAAAHAAAAPAHSSDVQLQPVPSLLQGIAGLQQYTPQVPSSTRAFMQDLATWMALVQSLSAKQGASDRLLVDISPLLAAQAGQLCWALLRHAVAQSMRSTAGELVRSMQSPAGRSLLCSSPAPRGEAGGAADQHRVLSGEQAALLQKLAASSGSVWMQRDVAAWVQLMWPDEAEQHPGHLPTTSSATLPAVYQTQTGPQAEITALQPSQQDDSSSASASSSTARALRAAAAAAAADTTAAADQQQQVSAACSAQGAAGSTWGATTSGPHRHRLRDLLSATLCGFEGAAESEFRLYKAQAACSLVTWWAACTCVGAVGLLVRCWPLRGQQGIAAGLLACTMLSLLPSLAVAVTGFASWELFNSHHGVPIYQQLHHQQQQLQLPQQLRWGRKWWLGHLLPLVTFMGCSHMLFVAGVGRLWACPPVVPAYARMMMWNNDFWMLPLLYAACEQAVMPWSAVKQFPFTLLGLQTMMYSAGQLSEAQALLRSAALNVLCVLAALCLDLWQRHSFLTAQDKAAAAERAQMQDLPRSNKTKQA